MKDEASKEFVVLQFIRRELDFFGHQTCRSILAMANNRGTMAYWLISLVLETCASKHSQSFASFFFLERCKIIVKGWTLFWWW